MGLLGNIFGGSNDKTSTVTPYGAPFIDYGNQQAQNLYKQGVKSPPTLAPVSKYTTQAMNGTVNLANQGVRGLDDAYGLLGSFMTGQGSPAADSLSQFASGQYQEDPRLQQMLDTNADRAANAAATRFGGGRYGSAAIGNGVGSAVADANNATMLQSNENARNRQLSAAGTLGGLGMQSAAMLPTMNNLSYDPMSRIAGVGDFYDTRAQTALDMKRNNGWDQLGKYNAIVQGNGALGRSTTTPGPSAAQSILGGAATGGALLGPWGAVAGGLLGAFG
jgi:hypothetical protein